MSDRKGHSEVTATPAERLMALFAGHSGAHGTHGEPEKDDNKQKWGIGKTARTIRKPVTNELWESHLAGERPLGIIPIREDSSCIWGAIDIDEYEADLIGIVKRIEQKKLPQVPSPTHRQLNVGLTPPNQQAEKTR